MKFLFCVLIQWQLSKEYGNICTIWITHHPVVVLSGFQTVKEGLINHSEELRDRPLTHFLIKAFNRKGIGFTNGHSWKEQRRFGIVTMRNLGLGKKGMEHQIEEEAHRLVEAFSQAKGQPLDPSLLISNAISTLISVVSFGYRFSQEDEMFQKLLEGIDVLARFGVSFSHVVYNFFPWLMKYLPGPHKKALSCMEIALSFAKQEIKKHKERQDLQEPQDFIDFYLLQMEKSKGDPNSTFNEENLAQCILDLFAAGTETTASTLMWVLLLMVAYPDVQERAYKEMEDVLGSSHSVSYQDRKKLPYTNAVIHEVQRAKYILPVGVPRRCSKELNMLGFHIPRKTLVVTDLNSVLCDPKQWETPSKFNPNHFLDKEGNFIAKEEFLPFGAGARVCLGEQMARMELFLFFTHLLRAFRFQLPEGVKEISHKPVVGLSMHPYPFKLCAVPRSSL
ncbi:cytochrome P450 2J2-like [Sceloporus undulatus]|uniref:cytochrome P450 2J2-like n=1 Tax=Sceloporus undulatus TaxID=8520 RepID=UPI001C4CA725|nr:cytochrome P450 2J2-like [Sceloporus undulatus]